MKENKIAPATASKESPQKMPVTSAPMPTPQEKNNFSINFLSGFFSGILAAGLLNPYDQALYLSITKNRPFFSWENFKNPYHGFMQTVLQRAISNGSYYILQSELKHRLYPYLHDTKNFSSASSDFCVGLTAGSLSGIISNGITATKYYSWSDERSSLYASLKTLWRQGGWQAFSKGIETTLVRNTLFGGIYEVSRQALADKLLPLQKNEKEKNEKTVKAFADVMAAALATFLTSPFNYARSIQFASSPNDKTPTMTAIFKNLMTEAKENKVVHSSIKAQCRFFSQRFGLAPGLVRVPIGMLLGQQIFDRSKSFLAQHYSDHADKSSLNRPKY